MNSLMQHQTMSLRQAQPRHPLPLHSRHAQQFPALPQPPQCKQLHGVTARAVREQKDPSRFANMDEAREYLMQSGSKGGGPIAGALNWLSNAAFGAGRAGAHVGSLYRQWLSLNADREHRRYDITACNTTKHHTAT